MGCDIHMVLEYYDENNGSWVGLHDYPYVDGSAVTVYAPKNIGEDVKPEDGWINWVVGSRNYRLFAELASVRGKGTQGHTPRNIPEDCSALTELKVRGWGDDAHSHSWLSLKEFIVCVAYSEGRVADLVQERITAQSNEDKNLLYHYTKLITGEMISPDNLDNYRIVFWFDN